MILLTTTNIPPRLRSGTLTRETVEILSALGYSLQFLATNQLKFLALVYMKTLTSWSLVSSKERVCLLVHGLCH